MCIFISFVYDSGNIVLVAEVVEKAFAELFGRAKQIGSLCVLYHFLSCVVFLRGDVRKISFLRNATAREQGNIGIIGLDGSVCFLPHQRHAFRQQRAARGDGVNTVFGQFHQGLYAVGDDRDMVL